MSPKKTSSIANVDQCKAIHGHGHLKNLTDKASTAKHHRDRCDVPIFPNYKGEF